MPTAVYAGSFDPVTVGHIDIIRRASSLFDQVIVAVGIHPSKRYWFDAQARVDLVTQCVASLPNVKVQSFEGLLVDFCAAVDSEVIVRGIRSGQDADYELRYAMANQDLSGVDTVMLAASPQHAFVSSSIVKEIFGNGGDVSRYVPSVVLAALRERNA